MDLKIFGSKLIYVIWLASLGFTFSWHLTRLHESSFFFSHLSSRERELTFRSELGLYYSYYKQLIEAESFNDGLNSLLADNKTEYPDTINVLQRFNVYPEVFLALVYRILVHSAQQLEISTKQCFLIDRGQMQAPVQSCIGWGDPAQFYVNAVFIWNGVLVPALFSLSSTLGGSAFSGVLCVAAFAFNNEEATRVQWAAQLRESFSYPFFVLQLLTLTRFLLRGRADPDRTFEHDEAKTKEKAKELPAKRWTMHVHFVLFTLFTAAFFTTWQFAQFVCATQLAIGMVLRLARLFDADSYAFVAKAHAIAFALSYVMLLANRMLLTSLYFAVLVAAVVLLVLDGALWPAQMHGGHLRTALVRVALCVCGFVLSKMVKLLMVTVADDGHIWEILRSKLDASYRTFDSQLYTCADVFDFLNVGAVLAISRTLLLPYAVLSALCATFYCLVHAFRIWLPPPAPQRSPARVQQPTSEPAPTSSESLRKRNVTHADGRVVTPLLSQHQRCETRHDRPCERADCMFAAALGYHLLQLLVFIVLALMIMRLKLLCVPSLCVFAGLLVSPRLVRVDFSLPAPCHGAKCVLTGALFVALLTGMALQGVPNLRTQHSVQSEFSDAATEAVLSWIASNTPPNATMGASMPFSATLKLVLGRPIVCHPHYENADLRRRVRAVYTLTSRKPLAEVHRALRRYGVEFAVLEKRWCLGNLRHEGCTHPEIWDLEDVPNRGRLPVCFRLQERAERDTREIDAYFIERYRSDDYLVVELRDRSKPKDEKPPAA